MHLMDFPDLDMDMSRFGDMDMSGPFRDAFNRMSSTRVVPVTLLGSTNNLPRGGPLAGESVSPTPPRKFDSLPRHLPSHQQHPVQHQQHPVQHQQHPVQNQQHPAQQQSQQTQQPQPQQQQSSYQQNTSQQNDQQQPPARRASPPAPSPAPAAAPAKTTVPLLLRKTSIDDFNDQIVNMLDDVERKVEHFREAAAQLEAEKDQILEMLNSVNLNTEMLRLGQGEREDINAITNRLLSRTKTVDIVVNTPRNPEQAKALQSINGLIEGVLGKLDQDLKDGKETCRRYLNACSPDQPEGPIDQRFQTQIIECTADDQKKIRRKLAQLIQQIERAERTCFPQY